MRQISEAFWSTFNYITNRDQQPLGNQEAIPFRAQEEEAAAFAKKIGDLTTQSAELPYSENITFFEEQQKDLKSQLDKRLKEITDFVLYIYHDHPRFESPQFAEFQKLNYFFEFVKMFYKFLESSKAIEMGLRKEDDFYYASYKSLSATISKIRPDNTDEVNRAITLELFANGLFASFVKNFLKDNKEAIFTEDPSYKSALRDKLPLLKIADTKALTESEMGITTLQLLVEEIKILKQCEAAIGKIASHSKKNEERKKAEEELILEAEKEENERLAARKSAGQKGSQKKRKEGPKPKNKIKETTSVKEVKKPDYEEERPVQVHVVSAEEDSQFTEVKSRRMIKVTKESLKFLQTKEPEVKLEVTKEEAETLTPIQIQAVTETKVPEVSLIDVVPPTQPVESRVVSMLNPELRQPSKTPNPYYSHPISSPALRIRAGQIVAPLDGGFMCVQIDGCMNQLYIDLYSRTPFIFVPNVGEFRPIFKNPNDHNPNSVMVDLTKRSQTQSISDGRF